MSRGMRRPFGGGLMATILLSVLLTASGADAKTTGVADDPTVQSGPCYDALVDKNAANPTTAPNRELGAACEAEHGDVDKAWARVVRLWGSDSVDLPDYGSYRPADAPPAGTVPGWVAWLGVLLTYVALGTPMRSAARLMGSAPNGQRGAVVDLAMGLILRALVIAAVVVLTGLPFLTAACGLLLIAWLALYGSMGSRPSSVADQQASAGALARHLAELINDALGAAAGLAALALFAQHSVAVFVVALLLAPAAAAAPILAGRRALRSTRFGMAAGRALLAAMIGEVLVLTPPLSGWLGGIAGVTVVVPAVLAALTFAPSLRTAFPTVSPAE